jgi:hypothetical protein
VIPPFRFRSRKLPLQLLPPQLKSCSYRRCDQRQVPYMITRTKRNKATPAKLSHTSMAHLNYTPSRPAQRLRAITPDRQRLSSRLRHRVPGRDPRNSTISASLRRLTSHVADSDAQGRFGQGKGRASTRRDGPALSPFGRELDSLQMQRLRFVGAYDRHHLDLHPVGLPGNGESPPRYI